MCAERRGGQGGPARAQTPSSEPVPPPSLPACHQQPSLLCKRRNSSHTSVGSGGHLLEVAKQPKSWEGLRGQSELALTPALPLRRDLCILPSAPWGPGNQYSPSNTCTRPALPAAGAHASSMRRFLLLRYAFSLAALAAKCPHTLGQMSCSFISRVPALPSGAPYPMCPLS